MQLFAIPGIAEVLPGDDLAKTLIDALEQNNQRLENGDVLVLAQKIVSKAEDRYACYDEVEPTEKACELGVACDKDPRLVQLILDESEEVLRVRPGVIIVQHKLGYVHANAGIDKSNLPETERERVLLLPVDPDGSANVLREALNAHFGVQIGVIINDSAGRAWRVGTQGFAIGTSGFNPLINMVGKKDRNGREMEVTEIAVADELAAAASYLMGQADEGMPAVVIRGANPILGDYSSDVLIRDKKMDMFR